MFNSTKAQIKTWNNTESQLCNTRYNNNTNERDRYDDEFDKPVCLAALFALQFFIFKL